MLTTFDDADQRDTSPIRKRPPLKEPPRALGTTLRLVPRGVRFLISEVIDSGLIGCQVGEVPRGEKIVLRGTDSKSCINEHTLAYEDNPVLLEAGKRKRTRSCEGWNSKPSRR